VTRKVVGVFAVFSCAISDGTVIKTVNYTVAGIDV
jgi:hypothetical protein